MKHTVIDHLQQISHMVRNVRKYEQDEDIHRTGSYENLCNYLITREIEHIEDQTTLVQGEVANSAVTDGKLEYLQYEMANLVTKNSELEDALVTIAGAMEQQKKVTAVATSPPPASSKSDIEKLFTAFLVEQKPPERSSKPSTSIIERKL